MSSTPEPAASAGDRRGADRRPRSALGWGPLLRAVLTVAFGPVTFPDEAAAQLGRLAQTGTLVYVMRSAGVLNYLYFNWVYARRNLPLARAVVGLLTFLYRPFPHLFGRSRDGTRALIEAVERGDAGMVFLRRPALLSAEGEAAADPFPRLLELQRRLDRPIYLVPQLLVLKRAPSKLRPDLADVVLGSADVPGRLHALVSFLFNRKRAFVKLGKPIDLQEVLRSEADTEPAAIARKVRGSLGVGLSRELRAVVGPPLKEHGRLLDETLRDRLLRDEIGRIAAATGRPEAAVERDVRRCLVEIAARYSPAVVDGANTISRWVFHRLYDGVHVDEAGLRRAADASRRAPLVLCPTHRSHVDYLLVSHVLFERGMTPPLVAAGANLSFFPLGSFFRRGGAFFIRRSFKGDRVYGAALAAYVRKLAHDGYTQEFYPEGGRTRTGRILQPKYGLIGMEVDAWVAGARDDLHFVPIAIDYEQLIEGGTYAKEAAGGEKQKEDLKGLLSVPAVLGRRWGSVFLQVDDPISLVAFAKSRGLVREALGPEQKKALTVALAHRIAFGMGRVQTITARSLAASALLAHRSRGLSSADLGRRFELLRALARARDGRFSPGVEGAPADPLLEGPVRKALRRMVRDGLVKQEHAAGETVFQVVEAARAQISFYKHNIVHHFQDEAVFAGALLSFTTMTASDAELTERAAFLSRLLKRELSFRTDVPLAAVVEETGQRLQTHGLLERREGAWAVAPGARDTLVFLRELLSDVVESYHVTLTALDGFAEEPFDRKELVKRCLERGRAQYLAGKIFAAEAISRPNFEGAIAWLEDVGLLEASGAKRLVLAASYRPPEARAKLCRDIERVLQR